MYNKIEFHLLLVCVLKTLTRSYILTVNHYATLIDIIMSVLHIQQPHLLAEDVEMRLQLANVNWQKNLRFYRCVYLAAIHVLGHYMCECS